MKNGYKKKTLICALLALSWAFGLTACAASENSGNTSGAAAQTELSENAEAKTAQTAPSENAEAETDQAGLPEEEAETNEGSNILVAYFSATNNTEGIAEKLAEGLDADLYEIVPEQPYTDEDLDYGDPDSRTSVETDDPDIRPAISGTVEHMEQYDIVFLGYPIWWGEAPRIMSTFIESYDFDGKTIVPFCTSGSSGFGSSDSALQEAADQAVWLEGKRFSAGASGEEVMEWADQALMEP